MMGPMYNKARGQWFEADAHQIETYEHLMANEQALVFLEMSLSKTVTVLSYLNEMIYREAAIGRVLVIAPDKVTRITWPDEMNDWQHLNEMRYSVVAGDEKKRDKALAADAEIFLLGEANVTWLEGKYWDKRKKEWRGIAPFDCIVIDELSLFKSRGSQRHKSLWRIIERVRYTVGMTGTFGQLVDLWAQVRLIDKGVRLGQTFGAYLDKYFRVRGNGMIVYEYIPKAGAEREIMAKIADIALSKRIKDTDIKMPTAEYVDIALRFDDFDMEQYEYMERELVLELGDGDVTAKTAADLALKLQQLTSGAIYDEDKNVLRFNTLKIDALEKLVTQHPDENFVVVYSFRHEVDRILERFPEARELGKGNKLRADVDEWNAGKIKMLILHPRSAGHGLNLQRGGRRLVWMSGTWEPELWAQTNARLIRRGVDWTVYIYRFIVMGTRDKKQAQRVHKKQSAQDFLMDEIKYLRQKHGI